MSHHFHINFIEDILIKLPAKARRRFSCVCRPWQALMSEPNFERRRLTKSGKYPETLFLMNYSLKSFHTVELKIQSSSYSDVIEIEGSKFLKRLKRISSKKRSTHSYRLIGSCHSLVCLQHFKSDIIFLFNPFTFEYKKLPQFVRPATRPKPGCDRFYGLGYDSSSDDYKLVVKDFCGDKSMLYSLNSNSWKSVQSYPCHCGLFCPEEDPGVFFMGALHWYYIEPIHMFDRFCCYYYIMSYNLDEEKFNKFPLPFGIVGIYSWNVDLRGLGVVDGCISIAWACNDALDCVALWRMCEYGVAQSWTKFVVINLEYVVSCFCDPLQEEELHVSILLIKNDRILLQVKFVDGVGQLLWFDFGSGTFQRVFDDRGDDCFATVCSMERIPSFTKCLLPRNKRRKI